MAIPLEYAEFVPAAIKEGFMYHHTTADKVVLTKWLPDNEPNMLPSYATRTAGVYYPCNR